MKLKKLLSLALFAIMILALACGCSDGGSASTPTPDADNPPTQSSGEPSQAPAEEPIQVAMILSGYKNDAGWNQSAYEGMDLAVEEFGIKAVSSEAVQQPDYESTMRDYASQGYDLIICVGNEFSDAAKAVAPSFPDVKFAIMNGNDKMEPNMAAYRFNTPETGFLAGSLAALYSKTGVVGDIGGTTLPHIQDAVDAFEVGAKYINPEIKVLKGYTETMTDIAKGKELGMAFAEQGADVLSANANSCSLGVIDAAKEKGILHIGYVSDQYEVAPGTVVISVIQSNQFMIKAIIQSVVDGSFTPDVHLYGLREGAIYITDYHDEATPLTDEQRTQMDEIVAGINDGSLKEQGILPKSVFEQ